MKSWFTYLRAGLSRKMPEDSIAGIPVHGSLKVNLKNLFPQKVLLLM